MRRLLQHIKGDKTIWAFVVLLAIASFLPIYSASTNLVYVVGNGSTFGHLVKHILLFGSGLAIMYFTHKVPYKYFGMTAVLMMPVVGLLLIAAFLSNKSIDGANASRWLRIPVVGLGFQPSTLANVVLMVFTARYLARNKGDFSSFKKSFGVFWIPVGAILILILPSNFSTTALSFLGIFILMFIGNYPLKYLMFILSIALGVLFLFVVLVRTFPDAMPNRVKTWESRIVNFNSSGTKTYSQVKKAKIAIASGVGVGVGVGKSIQKNFLPQSSSDFIFAIIVEETGLVGVLFIMISYIVLLFRVVVAARRASTVFATLLVVAVGLPIIIQAIVNMSVAVNLLPVTGQPLPLISSGGTSVWMTCMSIGMILSVTTLNDTDEEEPSLDENPLDILI